MRQLTKTFILLSVVGILYISCASKKNEQTSSLNIEKTVTENANKVANWQIQHLTYSTEGSAGYLHDYGIDAWTNATFYYGLSTWANTTNNSNYFDWLRNIGNENQWKLPENFKEYKSYQLYHADEVCMGKFYISMYNTFKEPLMIANTKERLDWIINHPPDSTANYKNKQTWTWIDAVFMTAPVYVEITNITGEQKYVDFMHQQFLQTYKHLYNKEQKLFYRDNSYIDKKEKNGKDVFWGRGNGWMAAALADILKTLPTNSPYRSFYETLYKEYIPTLINTMDKDFYWHASLLDPMSYPNPETSATALITYAIAYGVNTKLLPKNDKILALKLWKKLNTFVDENGKLGYVQPIGADPKMVTSEMTSSYGIGAYLLASSEIKEIITNE